MTRIISLSLICFAFCAVAAATDHAFVADTNSLTVVNLQTETIESQITIAKPARLAAAQPQGGRIYVFSRTKDAGVFEVSRDGKIEKRVELPFEPMWIDFDATLHKAKLTGGSLQSILGIRRVREAEVDISDLPPLDGPLITVANKMPDPQQLAMMEDKVNRHQAAIDVAGDIASAGHAVGAPKSAQVAVVAAVLIGVLASDDDPKPVVPPIVSPDKRYDAKVEHHHVVFRETSTGAVVHSFGGLHGPVYVAFTGQP